MPDRSLWADRVRERLTGLRLDPATEAETIEELTQHLDDRYRDLLARGIAESDAIDQACRELDGHPRLSQEISNARLAPPMAPIQDMSRSGATGLWDDVVFAWRRLRHAPGFAVTALVTVILTVGANTAIFSVADAVLFRPLPYADPDGVAIIQMLDKKSGRHVTSTPYAFLQAINDGCPSVSDVALIEQVQSFPGVAPGTRPTVESPDGPAPVPVMQATSNYFSLLGVQPARGRLFSATDAGGDGRTAVLSYAAWQQIFGADESIPGRTITLGSVSFEIVGVLPRGFVFPSLFAGRPALVVLRKPLVRDDKGASFHAIVRVAHGVPRDRAQAEVEAAVAPLAGKIAGFAGHVPVLEDVRTVLYPVGRPIMRFLFAGTLLILLLGCANLANMMIVRGRRSLKETAVRLALGASRARLIRPILFEALFLGLTGAAIAVLLTSLTFDLLIRQVPGAAYGRADVGVDTRVAAFALAMGLLCAIAFSLVPAWRASGVDVLALIQRRGGRGSRVRLGRPLVVLQVAIAIAVVFGAVLATRTFVGVLRVPLGFSPDNVVRINISPPAGTTDAFNFYRQSIETLRSQPGIISAGGTGTLPFGREAAYASTKDRVADIVLAFPGYFETVAIPVLRGRTLSWDDVSSEPAAAVVSSSAVRLLFGDREPIGSRFEGFRGESYLVVGVVGDVVNSLQRDSRSQVYVIPNAKNAPGTWLVTHVRDRHADTLAEIKRKLRSSSGAKASAEWWDDLIDMDNAYRDPRFQTIVLTGLGTLALGLTALGIFAVVAYLVSARTREMGVRLAVGASPQSLVALIIRQALVPVVIGIAGGVLIIQWGKKLAEAQLFRLDTSDVWSLGVAALTVVGATLVAAYLPARRATRINPTEVLRAE